MKKICLIIIIVPILLLFCSCVNNRSSENDGTNDSGNTALTDCSANDLINTTIKEGNSSLEGGTMSGEKSNCILSSVSDEGFPVVNDSEIYSDGSYYCITGCVPEYNVYNFDIAFVLSKTVSKGRTESFEYAIHENNFVEITKWLDKDQNIIVPAKVSEHPVAYIGREAFKDSEAKEVILPDSILAIGESAFYEAKSLENIKLSNWLLAISAYAFYGCKKLNEVSLPNCLQAIGESAFCECQELQSINMPYDLIIVGSEAFSSCNNLRGRLRFEQGLYSIASGAFEKTGIEAVEFSNGVYEINAGAFTDCPKLKEVILPQTMKDRENGLGWGMFADCSSLEKINIPENIIGLPSDIFRGCKSLKSITIPASIESLGSDVFDGCTSLKDIYFESKDCGLYYNSFLFTTGLTVHAPRGGSVEKFFRFRPLVKFVATD